ncbi:MAG: beta-propeller domain-containing protein [Candidatus Aenigmatarchaeota archaeon]|nr:beta-propeller domain-containing protein [Candidatus Aenigmarchaeota archaeon]
MNKIKIILIFVMISLTIASIYILKAIKQEKQGIVAFSSKEDFKLYLEEASTRTYRQIFLGMGAIREELAEITIERLPETTTSAIGEEASSLRVSTTNVQVTGIDEPDIVKTDGNNIYLSSQIYRTFWYGQSILPRYPIGETKVIKSFPPEELELRSKINESGYLLLYHKNLIILSYDDIVSYDISNPESPSQHWKIKLNSSLVSARLYGDKIYLVTRKEIDYYHPCPVVPLSINEKPLLISCSNIYHPTSYIPADTTYNIIILNPDAGEIEKSVSFIGTYGESIVYMSENAIYVTYTQQTDEFTLYLNFLKEKCSDILPSYIINQIEKIDSYDISKEAKAVELEIIISKYLNSLEKDERRKFENELSNRMYDYEKEHMREITKTGIVKIDLDMNIKAFGSVPGKPLNQFSLDEYQGYLRVATTVGSGSESANDVYILDEDLNLIGSILDLGLGERIYSVRFIQDKGYVVTFKQIDPFYILDLSDPSQPKMKGELKIPGYSSYLHPIAENRILGIGKEDWNVKISLFDVSSAENPKEVSKYILDETWSDILNTHHAFLLDEKHKIFFLPGGRGGYVFSYDNDKLELKKAISEIIARRAVYIEDYLYVIGDNKIVVIDEISWEKINELEF